MKERLVTSLGSYIKRCPGFSSLCFQNAACTATPRLFSADPNAKSDLDEEDAEMLGAFSRKEGEAGADFAVRVFDFVFRHKITASLEKEEMIKKLAKPPTALAPFHELVPEGAAAAAAGSDPVGIKRLVI
jgi:hypothetical protein